MPDSAVQRVALITGAAGGLGTALTRAFLDADWRVAAAAHRLTQNENRPGERLWTFAMNVTDAESIGAGVERLHGRWGRIDALVNNAGTLADGPLPRLAEADWDKVIDVNLKGVFLCCRAVLAVMKGRQEGHIINISSFAARAGHRGQANYAAAKAGVIGLTQTLAREVGPDNIRANAILPGFLQTPMTASLRSSPVLEEFRAGHVLGRFTTVEEVSRFVLFLASTQNISGQVFQLDSRIGRWT